MKKNNIIAMLQKIEGNPDIVLWNGYVGDYQHVDNKPVKGVLVKQTLSHYLEMCRKENCVDTNNKNYQHTDEELSYLKGMYSKVCKWEINEYVTEEDIKNKMYDKKEIFYLQPKPRNETFYDRTGTVSY